MAPAQVFLDLEKQIKMETPTKNPVKKNESSMEITDYMNLRCLNNCEDDAYDLYTLPDERKESEADDPVVDILNCADTSARVTTEEDQDATECSSSFGNTTSGSVSGLNMTTSDAEVESQFNDFDVLDGMFRPRKKRLTAHWRRFISPLMWRCKWIELQIKELHSQALKYDKELSAHSRKKQSRTGQFISEYSAARSVPISCQSDRSHTMKRRKRKRLEDTADLPSFFSRHNLFSYYENKKSEAYGVSLDDESGNQVNAVDPDADTYNAFGVDCKWPLLESRVTDDSLEPILWSIDALQSRIFKLKTQMNKLVLMNTRKLSSMDNSNLLMPANHPAVSARSPPFSPVHEVPVGALDSPHGHISDNEAGDQFMQDSTVSSFGEAASLPDIFESTASLLSAVDVSLNCPQVGDSPRDAEEDVLIHHPVLMRSPVAEKELQIQENGTQRIDDLRQPAKDQVAKERAESPVSAPDQEATAADQHSLALGQPFLRSCIGSVIKLPRNKRKRGGRRGGWGRWNPKKVYTRRSAVRKG